jgi:hypothetical protein
MWQMTWRWCFKNVSLTWQPRDADMAATWRCRGGRVALTWRSGGTDVAVGWHWRGCCVAFTWLPRGAHVAKFNTNIHKWWHHHIFSPLPITNIGPIILIEFSPLQDYNFNPWILFTKLNRTSITLKNCSSWITTNIKFSSSKSFISLLVLQFFSEIKRNVTLVIIRRAPALT